MVSTRPIHLGLICLCCLLIITASSFGAASYGHIYLTDGTVYENASFEFNKQFKVLELNRPDGKQNISLHKIAYITDFDGNDITRKITDREAIPVRNTAPATTAEPTAIPAPEPTTGGVTTLDVPITVDSAAVPIADTTAPDTKAVPVAGVTAPDTTASPVAEVTAPEPAVTTPAPPAQTTATPASPDEGPWVSKFAPESIRANRPPFSLLFHVGPKVTIPTFEWYDGLGAGFGFEGVLRIPVTRQIAIRAMASRVKLNSDISWIDAVIWRYYIAGEYYTALGPRRVPHKNWFYAYSGLGLADHRLSAFGYTDNQGKFTIVNGLGFMFLLSQSVGLDIGAAYDVVFVGSAETYDGYNSVQTAGLLDLRFSLSFVIPRSDN